MVPKGLPRFLGFCERAGLWRPLHLAGGKAPIAVRRSSLFSLQSCDAAATNQRLFTLDLAQIEACGLC